MDKKLYKPRKPAADIGEREWVLNPISGRPVKVGGRIYKRLIKNEVIIPPNVQIPYEKNVQFNSRKRQKKVKNGSDSKRKPKSFPKEKEMTCYSESESDAGYYEESESDADYYEEESDGYGTSSSMKPKNVVFSDFEREKKKVHAGNKKKSFDQKYQDYLDAYEHEHDRVHNEEEVDSMEAEYTSDECNNAYEIVDSDSDDYESDDDTDSY